MTAAKDVLCGLRQSVLRLELYLEEFLELSNRVSWFAPRLPSSAHAENPHIHLQRLLPPAQLQTPPYPPKLHQCPQPRVAFRDSLKAAICGEEAW